MFDGAAITCHWAYVTLLRRHYPHAKLRLDKTLIVAEEGGRLVMSGAGGSWTDLILYLIERFAGPATVGAVEKFFLLSRHPEGQAAYVTFRVDASHRDAGIARVQAWLSGQWRAAVGVEQLAELAHMTPRSFKRRFRAATGYAPLDYLQHLRIEHAKRCLENSLLPVDETAAAVGYVEPAFFRRVFNRVTQLTPSAYRAEFQIRSTLSAAP